MPLLPRWWRLVLVVLILLSLPILVGYMWLVVSALFERVHGLVPAGALSLKNWRFLWTGAVEERPSVWMALRNSLVFAGSVAALKVVVASMAAYAISRLLFPGRRALLGLILVLHAFPAISLIIGIYYILRTLGLFDTLLGVIMVKAALELPLGVWLMKGFFDNLSWEMEMAALTDGASRWQLFWRVAMPMVRPGLLALGTFAFISSWSEFILPFTLIVSGQNWTLAIFLQSFREEAFVDYGVLAAVSLFYALPILVLFMIGQRFLLNLYGGGLKG